MVRWKPITPRQGYLAGNCGAVLVVNVAISHTLGLLLHAYPDHQDATGDRREARMSEGTT